jgi:predicted TIM-barrel fold metal-dependent hydrolase
MGEAADIKGGPRIAAAIIGHGEFERGPASVQAALEAHVEAGRGRFRGLRANLFWSEDIDLGIPMPPKDLCTTGPFRDGFAKLAPMGLVCDVFAFAENLPEVARLAAAFPDTPIVIDHFGAPAYALQDNADGRARFVLWRNHIRALAACDNVRMKVGGAGGGVYAPLGPLELHKRAAPLGSLELASLIQPFYEECLGAFGTHRIMLESNFPIDRRDYGYTVLWNAFKRLTGTLTIEERADLYWRTAADFYRIDMLSGADTKLLRNARLKTIEP